MLNKTACDLLISLMATLSGIDASDEGGSKANVFLRGEDSGGVAAGRMNTIKSVLGDCWVFCQLDDPSPSMGTSDTSGISGSTSEESHSRSPEDKRIVIRVIRKLSTDLLSELYVIGEKSGSGVRLTRPITVLRLSNNESAINQLERSISLSWLWVDDPVEHILVF